MNQVTYKSASIVDADEEYIAYTANCAGTEETSAWGATKCIIKKFPYANVYANRKIKNKKFVHDDWLLNPGKVLVYNNQLKNERGIVVMLTQYTPSRIPFDYTHHGNTIASDTKVLRKQWFAECLEIIGSSLKPSSIAFLNGLHDGDHTSMAEYTAMIVAFAEKYTTIKVSIYDGGAARPHNPPAGGIVDDESNGGDESNGRDESNGGDESSSNESNENEDGSPDVSVRGQDESDDESN